MHLLSTNQKVGGSSPSGRIKKRLSLEVAFFASHSFIETEKSFLFTRGEKLSEKEHKVRVAVIGIGNCASALVQGVEYYKNAADDEFVPGLMHVNLGG